MTKVFLMTTFIFLICSCVLLNHKVVSEIRTDEYINEYAYKNNYQFDVILRVKQNRTIDKLQRYGMTGLQFVNLYDYNGELIRNESGDHCEINIMNYLKDSLNYSYKSPVLCDSCHLGSLGKVTNEIFSRPGLEMNKNYKVIIGWASFLNKYKPLRKRTMLVTNMIPELKRKYGNVIVIGLNLDPISK